MNAGLRLQRDGRMQSVPQHPIYGERRRRAGHISLDWNGNIGRGSDSYPFGSPFRRFLNATRRNGACRFAAS